jgi:hypothetical protein
MAKPPAGHPVLLGPWSGGAGERLFKRLVAIPGLYDGLHFAHLRTGSRLADRLDRASRARLVPALQAELKRQPADLILSVLATATLTGWPRTAAAGWRRGPTGSRADERW